MSRLNATLLDLKLSKISRDEANTREEREFWTNRIRRCEQELAELNKERITAA
jgi:hypothetical protein